MVMVPKIEERLRERVLTIHYIILKSYNEVQLAL